MSQMSPDRDFDWPKPTLDQAIHAGQAIACHYGNPFSKIYVEEPIKPGLLSDQDAKQKLLDLADQIMDGAVSSHVEIARVIRTLGHKMGPMGSVTTAIDLAAFRVFHAVQQKQETFQDK